MSSIFSKITGIFKKDKVDKPVLQTQTQVQAPAPMSDVDRIFHAVDSLPPQAQQNLNGIVGNLSQSVFGNQSSSSKQKPSGQRQL